MQVSVNCDDPICCDDELIRRVEGVIEGTLERFATGVFRVEARLRDLNSALPGDRDKVCSLEARFTGTASVTVEHEAPTLAEAIHVATGKLERLVARQLRALAVKSTVRVASTGVAVASPLASLGNLTPPSGR